MDKTREDGRIGAVLGGRYRITELLGEGGMGMVYRGERLQLGKPVAIKFLHTPYSRSQKFVARFEREARAMSKLSHPHLVSVIDFGVQDAPYIVMDFVTGSTVRDVLDAGPVPVARALSITRQVLFGLAHAHSEGVIHRDIKPGNIMLAELAGIGDHVRIFDFGLAKLHDSESEGDMSTAAIVGTPAYMAPEQARAEKIDARVDLYATGVVLFELLTGQKPFQGDDAYTVLCMQRDKAPPKLRALAPQLSPELEAVVAQALEKDVDKRIQTASDFINALDAVPEATGRPSSERELNSSDAIGYAKTQHQLHAPKLDTARIEDSTEGSLAGMPIAEPRPRRASARMWLMLVFIAVGACAFVILRVAPRSFTEQMASFGREEAPPVESASPAAAPPAEPPAAAPAAEPPAGEQAEPSPEPSAEPAAPEPAAEPEAPSQPEPVAAAAEPAAAAPPSEPVAGTEDEGAAADELSEAALAAADEALNETSESEAKIVEPPPSNAISLATVHALIRQNKTGQAMGVIQALRRKNPKSAELPYLLGDLYFDRHWWSDGLAKYREAIRLGPAYRKKASIQRNAIMALSDDRTYPRARALLVKDIGRAATQRLKKATKNDSSRTVRKRASSVLAALY